MDSPAHGRRITTDPFDWGTGVVYSYLAVDYARVSLSNWQ